MRQKAKLDRGAVSTDTSAKQMWSSGPGMALLSGAEMRLGVLYPPASTPPREEVLFKHALGALVF